jgi:Spy/CpxP family protein refolding chaperone
MNTGSKTFSYGDEMMNYSPCKTIYFVLIAALGLLLLFSVPSVAVAQETDQQPAEAPSGDPLGPLNLSPEQQQKLRAINMQNRDERARVNRRLKMAQLALEETLDADSPSQEVVEQRIRELASAQADSIRMRVMTELQIRSVLTPDQLRIWREMRLRNQTRRQQMNNPDARRDNQRNLPNQRNGIAPLFPNNRRNTIPAKPRP